MSARVDLVALHAEEYAAGRAPRLVPVTPARYLTLDGSGGIPGPGFERDAETLLRLVRTLRARARKEEGKDFRLPPLEALVGERLGPGPAAGREGPGPWKLLLRVPAFVRPADLAALPAADGEPRPPARIEELREGRCLQSLHVGPFAGVAAAVDRLRRAAADQELEPRGRLHCAWLTGPGRTPPERQRVLVRLPVKTR